jgi:PleD family two-component response regulator
VGDRGIVCRYGGEEFGVILPGMTNAEAADLAETIRAGIESPPFDLSALDGVPNELKVTVSIGVSAADAAPPKRLVNAEKLVQEADAAVYAAKKGGRNNVKVWGRLRNEDLAADSVSAPRVEPKQTAHAEGLRVLLIEDDALSALLVRSLLKQKPGVEVEWIGSGTEAIDRLTTKDADPADVVIADFHLDGIVASELMRLASRGPCAGVPFLIITSSDEPSVREKCFGAGAVGFITKQQLAKELNKWVGTVIETARAQNSQAAGGSPGTRAA